MCPVYTTSWQRHLAKTMTIFEPEAQSVYHWWNWPRNWSIRTQTLHHYFTASTARQETKYRKRGVAREIQTKNSASVAHVYRRLTCPFTRTVSCQQLPVAIIASWVSIGRRLVGEFYYLHTLFFARSNILNIGWTIFRCLADQRGTVNRDLLATDWASLRLRH